MNFLSGDASGAFLADDERASRPPRETDADGTIRYIVGSDSAIEIAITEVNRKYRIPVDQEDRYTQARKQMEKAYGRWRTSRGKNKYELEFMLADEGTELFSLAAFVKEFETASVSLEKFLQEHETRAGKRVPPWRRDLKQISEYP
jgi:hypothetical protein